MIISSRILFSLLLSCSAPLVTFSQTTPWKLAKDENGIKVYTRHVDGFDIDELKTELVVKGSLSAVVAIITDVDHYYQWIFACSESRVLQRISETEQYQYQVNDLPYPVSDRDIVIHFKMWQDSITKKVYTSSIADPTYIPANSGMVRLPIFIGSYELTPLPNGEVFVSYSVRLDPGGSIPDWMANLFIVKGPYESMLKMQERVESGKYNGMKFAFLRP